MIRELARYVTDFKPGKALERRGQRYRLEEIALPVEHERRHLRQPGRHLGLAARTRTTLRF
jgi:hypothetical protein